MLLEGVFEHGHHIAVGKLEYGVLHPQCYPVVLILSQGDLNHFACFRAFPESFDQTHGRFPGKKLRYPFSRNLIHGVACEFLCETIHLYEYEVFSAVHGFINGNRLFHGVYDLSEPFLAFSQGRLSLVPSAYVVVYSHNYVPGQFENPVLVPVGVLLVDVGPGGEEPRLTGFPDLPEHVDKAVIIDGGSQVLKAFPYDLTQGSALVGKGIFIEIDYFVVVSGSAPVFDPVKADSAGDRT